MTLLIAEQDHYNDLKNALAHPAISYLPKTGIIHIGAHQGQEVEPYLAYGFKSIILIEANPQWYEFLAQKFGSDSRIRIFNYAICHRSGYVDLHIHTSRSGSTEPASVLPMKRFNEIVKTLHTPETIRVPAITLDELIERHQIERQDFNFLNVDIQGAELLAFEGAPKTLASLDAVITEVNLVELYEGAPLEADLVRFLRRSGFKKVNSVYHELYDEHSTFPAWGECLFVKENRLAADSA